MTNGAEHDNRLVTGSEFFSRAQERLTFDVPAALTNPDAIARPDLHDRLDKFPRKPDFLLSLIGRTAAMAASTAGSALCAMSRASCLPSAQHVSPTMAGRFRFPAPAQAQSDGRMALWPAAVLVPVVQRQDRCRRREPSGGRAARG
jgi:hypothetical protein